MAFLLSPFSFLLPPFKYMFANKKNPFAHKAKAAAKKKSTGKRIGKSKPEKANNQRNRIIK